MLFGTWITAAKVKTDNTTERKKWVWKINNNVLTRKKGCCVWEDVPVNIKQRKKKNKEQQMKKKRERKGRIGKYKNGWKRERTML